MTVASTLVWRCLLGENEWCTADDPCFTCADSAHRARAESIFGCPPDCVECKTASLMLSPKVGQETRGRREPAVGFKDTNSWERGTPTDGRGMPFIDSLDGHTITQKEMVGRRREVTSSIRRNRQLLAATAASTTGSN